MDIEPRRPKGNSKESIDLQALSNCSNPSQRQRLLKHLVQELLKQGKKKLAKFVLDNAEDLDCFLPAKAVLTVYGKKCSQKEPFGGLRHFIKGPPADNSHFESLIEAKDVEAKMKTFKAHTAAGPDNVRIEDLREWDSKGLKLAPILNSWQ